MSNIQSLFAFIELETLAGSYPFERTESNVGFLR